MTSRQLPPSLSGADFPPLPVPKTATHAAIVCAGSNAMASLPMASNVSVSEIGCVPSQVNEIVVADGVGVVFGISDRNLHTAHADCSSIEPCTSGVWLNANVNCVSNIRDKHTAGSIDSGSVGIPVVEELPGPTPSSQDCSKT